MKAESQLIETYNYFMESLDTKQVIIVGVPYSAFTISLLALPAITHVCVYVNDIRYVALVSCL